MRLLPLTGLQFIESVLCRGVSIFKNILKMHTLRFGKSDNCPITEPECTKPVWESFRHSDICGIICGSTCAMPCVLTPPSIGGFADNWIDTETGVEFPQWCIIG